MFPFFLAPLPPSLYLLYFLIFISFHLYLSFTHGWRIIGVESALLKNELLEIFDPTEWFFAGMLSEKYFRKMKPFPISFHLQRHCLPQAVQKVKGLQQTLVAHMDVCPWAWTSHSPFRWNKYVSGGKNADPGLPQISRISQETHTSLPKLFFSIPDAGNSPCITF